MLRFQKLKSSLICVLGFVYSTLPLIASSSDTTDCIALKDLSRGFTSVAEKATPAVVSVKGTPETRRGNISPGGDPFELFSEEFFRRFFQAPDKDPRQHKEPRSLPEADPVLMGSGFIISKDGYILTNNHVAKGSSILTIQLNDGREFEAELRGSDPQADLALLKIEVGEELPFLTFGDSDELNVGEWAIAIGNPLGFEASLTVGVVSAKGRSDLAITNLENFIQTDAAINPGNSGGPLLNLSGNVIGVNTAIASISGGYMGIGFAIPSNMAKHIVNQLIDTGTVTRGFLGIAPQPINHNLAKSFGLSKAEGVLIAEVVPNSPAEEAGLKQGDVILMYNKQKVKHVGKFVSDIAILSPGTKILITVFRDGKELEIPVTIGINSGSGTHQQAVGHQLGFEVSDITPELRQQLSYSTEQGVVVTEVDPRSAAAAMGIRPGALILAVNKETVHNLDEFLSILKKTPDAKRILLLVKIGKVTRFITLPLN